MMDNKAIIDASRDGNNVGFGPRGHRRQAPALRMKLCRLGRGPMAKVGFSLGLFTTRFHPFSSSIQCALKLHAEPC